MKRIGIIVALIACLTSCSKDNDDVVNVELEGQWALADVSCFCFFPDDIEFSNHKLAFEGSTLIVTNEGPYQFLIGAGGNYTVNGNLITLSNDEEYRYSIDGDVLTLVSEDDPLLSDDEITLTYDRN
ncbi:hypothetical protein [Maribacter sp. 2-571]|uniref:hypothetical protein n=1 Tax=Maribacter sp. 2-571 TaxID=3417569 RepID=UPI003D336CE0